MQARDADADARAQVRVRRATRPDDPIQSLRRALEQLLATARRTVVTLRFADRFSDRLPAHVARSTAVLLQIASVSAQLAHDLVHAANARRPTPNVENAVSRLIRLSDLLHRPPRRR